jgi:hypothetical protein
VAGEPSEDGVLFPASGEGRSSTATGRAIVADAARAADPALAARVEAMGDWRSAYVGAFGALTEAGARSAPDAVAVARAGLDAVRTRLVVRRDGDERPLADAGALPAARLGTTTVRGTGEWVRELALPYRGDVLRGDALRRTLARWVRDGVVEPGCAAAVEDVLEHPEWLAVQGRTVVLLGAGAEMGPLEPLAAWGADVLAVDLPGAAERIGTLAARGAGTVRTPDGGADLLRALPELQAWVAAETNGGPVAVAGHVYADGAAHVRLAAAADVLATSLPGDVAVAALATPTDAYLVPPAVVADARARWRARGAGRVLQAPLRLASRGRLLRPAYPREVAGEDGRTWGLADGLVAQQGPNYALAKRIQRWRATVTEADGARASLNVAPATATRSVLRNRALAAAYAGAHRFGVEVFSPATTRVLMAALLVRDLHRPAGSATRDGGGHPEDLLAAAAAHGALWRVAYEPRSALGLAAVLGAPASLLRRP